MTQGEIENIANKAAERAVQNMLLTLGIDVSDPLVAQKDFAALRELAEMMDDDELRADLAHTRRWRKAVETVEAEGITWALRVLAMGVLGLVAAAWLYSKGLLPSSPTK